MTKDRDNFKEKLQILVKTKSKTQIAKDFGISRQALYKWFEKYEIDYKVDERFFNNKTDFEKLNSIADKILNENK